MFLLANFVTTSKALVTRSEHCPDRTPAGFSGILISEVLHFLPGQGIEEAIAKLKGLLAPNGTLCITMFSPESNISGAECPFGQRMREVYAERQAAGMRNVSC